MADFVFFVQFDQSDGRVVFRTLGFANSQQLSAVILRNEPVVFRVNDQYFGVGLKQAERKIRLYRPVGRIKNWEYSSLFGVVESNVSRFEGFARLLNDPSIVQK